MHRKITPLWGEKKVVLHQAPRAVTPFGRLSVFIELLGKMGFTQQISEHLPGHLKISACGSSSLPQRPFSVF